MEPLWAGESSKTVLAGRLFRLEHFYRQRSWRDVLADAAGAGCERISMRAI
jgi:hypothetical protein